MKNTDKRRTTIMLRETTLQRVEDFLKEDPRFSSTSHFLDAAAVFLLARLEKERMERAQMNLSKIEAKIEEAERRLNALDDAPQGSKAKKETRELRALLEEVKRSFDERTASEDEDESEGQDGAGKKEKKAGGFFSGGCGLYDGDDEEPEPNKTKTKGKKSKKASGGFLSGGTLFDDLA